MRFVVRVSLRVGFLAGSLAATATAVAQAPPPEPAPTPAAAAPVVVAPPASAAAPPAAPVTVAPAPTPVSAMRIVDAPVVSIARLPNDNPFGSTAAIPAALPQKLPFLDATVTGAYFASVRVDPTGKAVSVRRERDPIPSVSAEALKSFARWTFSPARRGGQAVDTWGAYRVELSVEVRAPKVLQVGFTPITPTTPIPPPLAWGTDNDWLESRKPPAVTDGTAPIDQVDTAPLPQKTPWSADSYKGPFTIRFWVHVDKAGHVDRAIPIEASDPILLSYFRRSMSSWALRPAQNGGAPAESWNDLSLAGQVSYSADIRQIAALRRPIGP